MRPKRAESPDVPSPVGICVKASTASGRTLVLPCETVDEDRIAGSEGTDPLDRLQVEVGGENFWVERRDLCFEDGEPVEWLPYDLPRKA